MKKIFVFICISFVFTTCKQTNLKEKFTPEALEQKIYALNGSQTSVGEVIARHKGNKIVIDIWASWCKDCIAAMPEIAKLQTQYPNVKFIFFSVDLKEDNWKNGVEKYINNNNIQGEQYFFNTGWKRPKKDEGVENDFIKFAKLDWIPRYMVLDENGEIICYYAKSTTEDSFIEALKK